MYDEKTGEYIGPNAALVKYIANTCDVPYELMFTSSIEESIENGADVLLGMMASEEIENKYPLSFTKPYLLGFNSFWTAKGNIVDFEKNNKVATIRNIESVNRHIHNYYPNWEIVPFEDKDSAIKAVNTGLVDVILLDNIVEGNTIEDNKSMDRINDFEVPMFNLSMGVNLNKETALAVENLLNKTFTQYGRKTISTIMFNNKVPVYNLETFLDKYGGLISNIIVCIFILFIIFNLLYIIKLYRVAYYDKELKIKNRNYLIKYGNDFCRKNTTVIYLDIAQFKQINLAWGAKTGDKVRKFVVENILKHSNDEILVSETSSLNFICILPYIDDLKVNNYLDNLMSKISVYDDKIISMPLQYHIGIYRNFEGSDIHISASRAEMAVFEAKKQQTERFTFYMDLEQLQKNEKIIENKMHSALENEEFKVFYNHSTKAVMKIYLLQRFWCVGLKKMAQ